jgi:hypothetical protein
MYQNAFPHHLPPNHRQTHLLSLKLPNHVMFPISTALEPRRALSGKIQASAIRYIFPLNLIIIQQIPDILRGRLGAVSRFRLDVAQEVFALVLIPEEVGRPVTRPPRPPDVVEHIRMGFIFGLERGFGGSRVAFACV